MIRTEIQEAGQSVRMAHVRIAFRGRRDPAVPAGQGHIQDTVGGTGNVTVPFLGAAGVDNDIRSVIIHSGIHDLTQVSGSRSELGLQVGPDHIDHDRTVLFRGRQIRGQDPELLRSALLLLMLAGKDPVGLAVLCPAAVTGIPAFCAAVRFRRIHAVRFCRIRAVRFRRIRAGAICPAGTAAASCQGQSDCRGKKKRLQALEDLSFSGSVIRCTAVCLSAVRESAFHAGPPFCCRGYVC